MSASCDDKLKIASRLSAFGTDFIEAGWPGSNPKDAEFFRRAQTELDEGTRTKLVAFGSTRRKGVRVEDDPQIKALVDSGAPTVCIVAKGHLWQVTEILRATPEENIDMIRESVSYLVGRGLRVMIDLEHFFDGYKYDSCYALKCCHAAANAGARCLVLCDTNGASMPWQVDEATRAVINAYPTVTVGMHAHNDCGMAVANSVSAARAGAGLIQGTINGIGERTGNADLCSIIPSLALHVGSKVACLDKLPDLTSVSRFVDETFNRAHVSSAPFVGTSAFAHKGGLHVAAMERSPMSYQHVDPAAVGNEKRILISELSGRQNILGKIHEVGDIRNDTAEDAARASERATAILNRVKQLESYGYTFEGAEASVDLMILHGNEHYCPPFCVLDYSTMVSDSNLDSASRVVLDAHSDVGPEHSAATARATIKVRTIDLDYDPNSDAESAKPYVDRLEVSDGNGPVDALASALKRALIPNHPHVEKIELVDYKVRILDPEQATGAATRVMIEFRDPEGDISWTTVSVDRNVISASLNALVDGFEYALIDCGCLLQESDFLSNSLTS